MSFCVNAAANDLDETRADVSPFTHDRTYDEFIVTYKEESEERLSDSARALSFDDVTMRTGHAIRYVRRLAVGADLIRVERRLSKDEAIELMDGFLQNSNVDFIEPNAIVRPALVPNDGFYNQQWYLHPAEDESAGLNAEEAWDIATGAGVIVAVIDSLGRPTTRSQRQYYRGA